jgi:hypothetical protein
MELDVGQASVVVDDTVGVDIAGTAVTCDLGPVSGRPVPGRLKALQSLGVLVEQCAGLGPFIASSRGLSDVLCEVGVTDTV